MDFKLTDEQQMFFDTVRRFAEAELAEGAVERANSESFPWDVAERFAEMGLLGITIPVADGGIGGGLVNAILAIQAVAEVCPRSGDVIQATNFGPVRTFAEFATPDQKQRFLGKILAGKA